MQKLTFVTTDNIAIVGVKNEPKFKNGGVLCLPMMPATKESYLPLLMALEQENYAAMAIDWRGHGESTQDGTLDYKKFKEPDHQNYRIDAAEAISYLSKLAPVAAVIGASIGANIALELQAEHQISKSILLSPSLDYWGVKTLPAAKALQPNQACYIITSEEIRQSGPLKDQTQELFTAMPITNKKLDILPGTAHGTDIVMNSPEQLQKITDFITQ